MDKVSDEPPDRRQVRFFRNAETEVERSFANSGSLTRSPLLSAPLQGSDLGETATQDSVCKQMLELLELLRGVDIYNVEVDALKIISIDSAVEELSKMEKAEQLLGVMLSNAELRYAFLENPQEFVNTIKENGVESTLCLQQ